MSIVPSNSCDITISKFDLKKSKVMVMGEVKGLGQSWP